MEWHKEFKENYKKAFQNFLPKRTGWIVEHNNNIPRLITYYIMITKEKIKELDIVAMLSAFPEEHLGKGAIGTIVHVYNNNFYEVEFSDLNGQTYALLTLPSEKLLLLKHDPVIA